MSTRVQIENGTLIIDGKRTFVWSADYPYYRDQRSDWPKQLDNLKKMNVNVVTFYIPWRHHAPTDPLRAGGRYDFRGELNDRTDVLEFIRLIRERGMYCIAKPGPYIHAETRFGSLPDYVLPENNPSISVRIDMQGEASPACWGFAKPPAPMDPNYLPYVEDWFRAVAREVIAPNEYPNGPILAVQVLNEGIYSDGAYAIDKIHFDAAAVGHYREFLRGKYGSIATYNEVCGTSFDDFNDVPAARPWAAPASRGATRPWIDWAEFGMRFYKVVAKTYVDYLRDHGVTLPMVININPPVSPRGAILETYMGRYNAPDLSSVVQYGYTNWCGVVSHHEDAWLKYKIVGKHARGINMEENWGFDSYDPPYYWSVQPSFFQSLAYMLWGATGLNIYLGVSCDCWTDYLAVDAGGVYMHNHPIAEDGTYRASFWTCQQMGALMKRIGDDLVEQPAIEPVAWAFYSPYAHAASWDSSGEDWKRAGFSGRPHAAWFGWDSFMALCAKAHTQNGFCCVGEETLDGLARYRVLFLDGSDWMDEATQQKLVDYVDRGGVLVMTSRVPELDEFFRPCTLLRDRLFPCKSETLNGNGSFKYAMTDGVFKGTCRGNVAAFSDFGPGVDAMVAASIDGRKITCGIVSERGRGKAVLLGFLPWQTECGEWGSAGLIEYIAAQIAGVRQTATVGLLREDPLVEVAEFRAGADRRYVYILTRKDKPATYKVLLRNEDGSEEPFEIHLPAFSGALVGFEGGRISCAFIKGNNDLDKSHAIPKLHKGDEILAAADSCDLYFCRLPDGSCEVSVVNLPGGKLSTSVTLPGSSSRVDVPSLGAQPPYASGAVTV